MTPAERVFAITTIVLACHAGTARAQSAEAEVLFRDGRGLIKAGRLAEGCSKIEASERLESSTGTLLNLGDCREKLGKLASAWAAFRKAEATAKHSANDDKRGEEARRRARALEPLLSTLALEIAESPDRLVIKRDGEIVDPALLGTAVPIDAGTYRLTAEAPGYAPWRSDIVIPYKTKRRVSIPALRRIVVAVPPAVAAVSPAPSPSQAPVVVHHQPTWSPWRKLSVSLAIAGTGAIGTGVYFGMRSRNYERDADIRCPLSVCTDPAALRDNSRARDAATTANILYIAGGISVASALALWFVGAPGETTVITPTISSTQAGASLAGRF